MIHHPEFLLEGTPEEARLDPDNLHVLLAHLRAATFELPFEPGEVFGPAPADDFMHAHKWKRGVRERKATVAEIRRKASKIAPAYNKGALQYLPDERE